MWNLVAENGNIQLCKDSCMNNSFSMGHIPYQYCIGFFTYTDYYGKTRCQFKAASATVQCKDAAGKDMYIITNEKNFTCPTSCDRGIKPCKNYAKQQSVVDIGTCCSHESCDLNEVRSLPWEPRFGSNLACYGSCDDIRCYPQERCQRGLSWCTNSNDDGGNCCAEYDCDLDEVRKLPWDPTFGKRSVCYARCDFNKCYPTETDTTTSAIATSTPVNSP